jgi:NADPH:quinone reductase-like Zn-dependent oxidoreductase
MTYAYVIRLRHKAHAACSQERGDKVRAIVGDRYGGPEELGLRELDRPGVGAGEVLVRVRAAGLHVGDVFAMRGAPFLVRLSSGISAPKTGIPGLDLAGVVAAVGPEVTRFAPGDEVFGLCAWPSAGACAEYAVARESTLAPMPAGLTFEEAAAIPTSASAALHGLRDAGRVQAGQRVLVNGASGGVGTFAVQIARRLGAEVTAVCGPSGVDLVRGLGAHDVLDYTIEDVTRDDAVYDVILDNVENHPLNAMRAILTRDGTLVCNSGTGAGGAAFLVRLVAPVVLDPFVPQRLRRPLSNPKREDLDVLAGMVADGSLRPVIDTVYALEDTADALRHVESGHPRGKIVVRVAEA